jgi:hypothetical protein
VYIYARVPQIAERQTGFYATASNMPSTEDLTNLEPAVFHAKDGNPFEDRDDYTEEHASNNSFGIRRLRRLASTRIMHILLPDFANIFLYSCSTVLLLRKPDTPREVG